MSEPLLLHKEILTCWVLKWQKVLCTHKRRTNQLQLNWVCKFIGLVLILKMNSYLYPLLYNYYCYIWLCKKILFLILLLYYTDLYLNNLIFLFSSSLEPRVCIFKLDKFYCTSIYNMYTSTHGTHLSSLVKQKLQNLLQTFSRQCKLTCTTFREFG